MRILLPFIIVMFFFASFFTGSGKHTNSVINPLSFTESMESDTLLKMERTICFGTCPSYTLSILQNGDVTFNGREFVEHKGEATGEISQENLDVLIQKIRDSHFMEIPSNPECESRMTDHPSVFLTIWLADKQHSITHYQGCKGFQYEKKLYDLEETIDSLSGAKKWVEGTV